MVFRMRRLSSISHARRRQQDGLNSPAALLPARKSVRMGTLQDRNKSLTRTCTTLNLVTTFGPRLYTFDTA